MENKNCWKALSLAARYGNGTVGDVPAFCLPRLQQTLMDFLGCTTLSLKSRRVHLRAVLFSTDILSDLPALVCDNKLKYSSWLNDVCSFTCEARLKFEPIPTGGSHTSSHRHWFSHVPSQRPYEIKAAGSGYTCSFFKSAQFIFLSLFVYYCTLHGFLKAAYKFYMHPPTHTHLCYNTIEKYLLVSATNRALRIHPLMRTMLNKAEQLVLFHTTPV